MSVIAKKGEKVSEIVAGLPAGFTFEQFLAVFQAKFPKDWARVVREFDKHERKTKPGKSHPMPEPTQYMRNAQSVHLASARNTLGKARRLTCSTPNSGAPA